MKDIIEKFKSGLITLEEANLQLARHGYQLKDPFTTGKYYLFPLESEL